MLKLKSVNFGQQQFQNHQLEQSQNGQLEWLVGRSSSCDLVLPSPEVSRVHGRIIYSNDDYYFVDDGSTSGSLLNGESIPANGKRLLHPGDLLQLGETFLHIEALTPPSTAAIPQAIVCPPMLHPEQTWTNQDLLCRCCRIVDETPDVKTFYFVAESPVLFHYKPGQFANLEFEIDGKPVLRSYSISSSPTRPYHLSFTIKRVPSPPDSPETPSGLVSNWLHDRFRVGDQVKLVGGPIGHFTCLPDLPAKLLFISAGSGITPMMSMSRWMQEAFVDRDIIFLHSARTPEDIVFRAELEAMTIQQPNFRLAVTLTQQPSANGWMGLTGRISQAMLQLVVPDLCDRAIYVCGPEAFMQSVKAIVEAMQFPMQNYYEESFGSKKTQVAPRRSTAPIALQPEPERLSTSNGRSHHTDNLLLIEPPAVTVVPAVNFAPSGQLVHFLKSGQHVPADGSTSILELAEQEGISIRSACRSGVCGACKVLTQQGQVHYDTPPTALTETEQQAGYVLACVAHPIDHLVVEA